MLNKTEIKNLLRNGEYNKIISIFKTEYTEMIINFSKKNNMNIPKDAEIEEIIMEITELYPGLEGYMNTLSNILFSPDMNIAEHIDFMLSNYNSIISALT